MIPRVPLLVHNTAADQQIFPNSQAAPQHLVQPMSLSSSVHVQEPACKHERAHMQTAPQSNQMLWGGRRCGSGRYEIKYIQTYS